MQSSQQPNRGKFFCRASPRQRFIAGVVFVAAAALLGLLRLAATDRIDVARWINPCGMKQRWNLPCPTCGMTTAALAFGRGRILQSFYIQPAAALFCSAMVAAGFLAFLIVVFGVYSRALVRLFNEVKIKHVIAVLLVIIAAGWIVTLARALAAKLCR